MNHSAGAAAARGEAPVGEATGVDGTTRRPVILQISGMPPRRPADGSAATFSTLEAMCRAGHRVTLAFFGEASISDDPYARELVERCGGRLRLLPLPQRSSGLDGPRRWAGTCILLVRLAAAGFIASLVRRASRRTIAPLIGLWQGPERAAAGRVLRAEIATGAYDAVQVDYPWMILMVDVLPAHIIKVFVVHELLAEMVRQDERAGARLRRLVAQREGVLMRRYHSVVTLTEDDADAVRTASGLGADRIHVSPVAVAWPPGQEFVPVVPRASVRFTFLGGHAHPPNAEAVAWLATELVPHLSRSIPGCRLEVVGRHPAAFVAEHESDTLRFVGFVEELSSVLPGSIFLCPVRRGSGMRIKILDAILHGAPVISTAVGARGLGLVPEIHFLAAERPEDFAQQAARLVDGDVDVPALVARAQREVHRRFAPAEVAAQRGRIYDGLRDGA